LEVNVNCFEVILELGQGDIELFHGVDVLFEDNKLVFHCLTLPLNLTITGYDPLTQLNVASLVIFPDVIKNRINTLTLWSF